MRGAVCLHVPLETAEVAGAHPRGAFDSIDCKLPLIGGVLIWRDLPRKLRNPVESTRVKERMRRLPREMTHDAHRAERN